MSHQATSQMDPWRQNHLTAMVGHLYPWRSSSMAEAAAGCVLRLELLSSPSLLEMGPKSVLQLFQLHQL